ncbi:Hypothetical protein CAP_1609 [Chondromyces apiculatus DSM 436]|uniref:Uncharacterized protein n=2 Tax=Chondromyces apiculatus TaxID=51 RepID=A0A017SSY3_9BACT|nr:Hypothetical protein CAP_1609 [Chondromyces apiculatus DSM 436]
MASAGQLLATRAAIDGQPESPDSGHSRLHPAIWSKALRGAVSA